MSSGQGYVYPNSIMRDLVEAHSALQLDGKPALPPSSVLQRMLDVAFHASLMTEEGRKPRFRLAFCRKEEVLARHGANDPEQALWAIVFGQARKLDANDVLRLAPAADFRRSLIAVDTAGDGEANCLIWGMVDFGSSYWQMQRGESHFAHTPPRFLTISSFDTGSVVISVGEKVILRLEHGRLSYPLHPLTKGPVANFFKPVIEEMYQQERAGLEKYKVLLGQEGQYFPQVFYISFLLSVLSKILEESHGALLIMQREPITVEPQIEMSVKYPCAIDRAWDLLVKKGILVEAKSHLAFKQAEEADQMGPRSDGLSLASTIYHEASIDRALSDLSALIAQFSSVDGAVIVTDKLKILGFGAELRTRDGGLPPVKRVRDNSGNDGKEIAFDSYGTRHRSAFRYCWNNPNSLAFIVSQDGGLKVAMRIGGEVRLWPDVEATAISS